MSKEMFLFHSYSVVVVRYLLYPPSTLSLPTPFPLHTLLAYSFPPPHSPCLLLSPSTLSLPTPFPLHTLLAYSFPPPHSPCLLLSPSTLSLPTPFPLHTLLAYSFPPPHSPCLLLSPSTLSLPTPPLPSLHTHHDVSMETEGKPVGEHPLGYRLCSPQEELRVGLGHCPANQLTQQGTEDPAGGEKKGMRENDINIYCKKLTDLFIHFASNSIRSDSSPSFPPSLRLFPSLSLSFPPLIPPSLSSSLLLNHSVA